MFIDPQDKLKLLHVLKAFVEEWGAENVVVMVPVRWSNFGPANLGPVAVKYEGDSKISIVAKCGESTVSYEQKIPTKKVAA